MRKPKQFIQPLKMPFEQVVQAVVRHSQQQTAAPQQPGSKRDRPKKEDKPTDRKRK